MRIARRCLSLILAILCYGLSNTAWCEAAFAEVSATSTYRIVATYRVDFGGFNLGNFRLTTVLRGSEYEARGEGQFSVLGGLLYAWRGSTASKGKLNNGVPEPATYAFNYDSGDGNQRLRVTFDNGAVTQVYNSRRPMQHAPVEFRIGKWVIVPATGSRRIDAPVTGQLC